MGDMLFQALRISDFWCFLKDTQTGVLSSNSSEKWRLWWKGAIISNDGRYVIFDSSASNLISVLPR
jgi:hypothetical protein